MNTTGKVFGLLVTSGNSGLLPANGTLDSLAEGQLGVFDNDTNLSVANLNATRNFYLAVKNQGKIKTSAGQYIQGRLVHALTHADASQPQPFIFEITDYTAECETDYALKLEVRNGDIYQRQGFVQFTDTFAVRTGCCDACLTENCNTGNKFELTQLLIDEILNSNKDYIVSVQAIEGPGGDVITDLAAYEATDNTAPVGIRITLGSTEMNQGMPINVLYKYNRASWGIPVLVDGFSCSGKVTVTQNAKPGEGLGYDLRQKEFFQKGWEGSPYRTNVITGLAKQEYSNYVTQENVLYKQFAIVHNHYSEAGWGEYVNELATLVAIPSTATATITAFTSFFNAMGTTFGVKVQDTSSI